MRPLVRPTVATDRLANRSAYSLLTSVFGPYCAISEQPVHDNADVWDKDANSEFPCDQPPAERWKNLLLLSPATSAAWRRHHDVPPSQLLIPDETRTFQLEDSPFLYQLEKIDVNILGDDDQTLPISGPREMVIVRGTNERAQATIEMFSLNTEYFDQQRNQLRIPEDDYLAREHALLLSRTLAWHYATLAADGISALTQSNARQFIAQLQISAAATGHWCVWATVLWNRLRDGTFIGEVLGGRTGTETNADLIGFGPHNEFPGTAPGWLFLAARRALAM